MEKSNGKKRPLGIPSPRDKVVLKAMHMILEKVYEPTFLNANHGFRPNCGTHSALESITKWSGTK
jgi:retron-type reverse transcriptase